MRIIMTILFFGAFVTNAQVSINVEPQMDKYQHNPNHYISGFIVGVSSNAVSYSLLDKTDIKPVYKSFLSFAIGLSSGVIYSGIKKQTDLNNNRIPNNTHLFNITLSAYIGSLTASKFLKDKKELLDFNTLPLNAKKNEITRKGIKNTN